FAEQGPSMNAAEFLLGAGLVCAAVGAGLCQFVMIGLMGIGLCVVALALLLIAGAAGAGVTGGAAALDAAPPGAAARAAGGAVPAGAGRGAGGRGLPGGSFHRVWAARDWRAGPQGAHHVAVPAEVRARAVGLYWGVRSFALCTAALAGAAVWYAYGPERLLYL